MLVLAGGVGGGCPLSYLQHVLTTQSGFRGGLLEYVSSALITPSGWMPLAFQLDVDTINELLCL